MGRPSLALLVLVWAACSHAPPADQATPRADRREEWLLALRSDLERIGANDGFEGQVRVLHQGKAEIDRTWGPPGCLPLGAGRRLLATVAVARLVEERKLGWDDRLDRRLPPVAGTSLAPLTVTHLLTDSAGMVSEPAAPEGDLARRLDAAAKVPLQAPPGTLVDPADDRPWLLVERVVAAVSGTSFEQSVQERVLGPAGMSGTSLAPGADCPAATLGVTTLEDQFRLVEALRDGKLVSAATRDALWAPRLPLGPGSDVGDGFFVRTRGEQRAVGVSSEGRGTAYELWLNPAGNDALVLLGRTPPRTARGIRTALGEFYALPPGPPQAAAPRRRPVP